MNEAASGIRDSLTARLGKLGRPYIGCWDTALDVRHIPCGRLRRALDEVVEVHDVVMHGNGRPGAPYPLLTPRASNLILKVPSVYGSTDARVVLGAAVLARNYTTTAIRHLIDGGNGFAAAMHVRGRERIFESPPGIAYQIFAALKGWLPERNNTFCEGAVYLLDRRGGFTQEDPSWDIPGIRRGGIVDTDHEWNAVHEVAPLLVLRVSAALAFELFTPDTIHVYSKDEMAARRALSEAKRGLLVGGI